MVSLSTDILPDNKPRYCMGVGFPVDLVVCVALGVDMFDCVYPTRTARFGSALVDDSCDGLITQDDKEGSDSGGGVISLKQSKYATDFKPLEKDCTCYVRVTGFPLTTIDL